MKVMSGKKGRSIPLHGGCKGFPAQAKLDNSIHSIAGAQFTLGRGVFSLMSPLVIHDLRFPPFYSQQESLASGGIDPPLRAYEPNLFV
ncbi:MAG: hypothetical protein CM15mP49_13800 [Actinomycetota bacterium]|nr:MAG: hypothetical protein CM15mP49_13800 [Actinomycetota bacterium]